MNSSFLSRFPRQLGHWTIHGICNSLPSFIIALVILRLWKSPQAVAAMVLAISIFIIAFAVMTSLPWPLSDKNHILGRSIRLGAKIRSCIGCISVPLAFTPAVSITPDFWCGCIAAVLQNGFSKWAEVPELAVGSFDNGPSKQSLFFSPFTLTLLEGVIISFLLLMISFFCVIFLQTRERRRMLKAAGIR